MARIPSQWEEITSRNPDHSRWYIQRFRDMAARGDDLAGEARLIDAMVSRNSHILDAGCGPGRVGAFLHESGHKVVGVDVDPALIDAAEIDHPGPTWLVGDLAELDLSSKGIAEPFDAIVCAGNVMGFLAPQTRGEVLSRFTSHLAAEGRAVVGFGTGRGYTFEEFFADCDEAGLKQDSLHSTWDLRPFTPESDFLVAILSRA